MLYYSTVTHSKASGTVSQRESS